MQIFTNRGIVKLQEAREMISCICDNTVCSLCPLSGQDGCEEGKILEILDNIICYAEKNKGGI